MSFTLNNQVTMRNLEEQVQKNKEDIAKHYAIDRAMSNLGIKVVGQVATSALLPDPTTYQGEYGDTYAVGSKPAVDAGEASYEYYVFTRPDPNSGEYNNYWLNVGKISIAGPQGIQGIQGEQGIPGPSTKWFYGSADGEETEGDFLLASNGDVFKYVVTENGSQWVYQVSIKGPQGIQGIQGPKGDTGEQGPVGPKGDTGDAGGFINIRGILSSTSQLPLPSTLDDRTIAYLVGNDKELYIQVGETSDDAVWTNMGPLNAATLVSSGGVYQNLWNADTKLDKDTSTTTYNQVYVKAANGGQGHINVTKQTVADAVVQRQSDGNIYVPVTPAEGVDATSKKYVDDIAVTKVDKLTQSTGSLIYTHENGVDKSRSFYSAISADSVTYSGGIPTYREVGGNGASQLTTGTPGGDFSCVNLKYFNANKGVTLYKHTIQFSINWTSTVSGSQYAGDFTVECLSTSSTPVQSINNNTWFNLPPNATIIESGGNVYGFHMNATRMNFYTIDNNQFIADNWEMWRDMQEGWPILNNQGETVSLTFISDNVTTL